MSRRKTTAPPPSPGPTIWASFSAPAAAAVPRTARSLGRKPPSCSAGMRPVWAGTPFFPTVWPPATTMRASPHGRTILSTGRPIPVSSTGPRAAAWIPAARSLRTHWKTSSSVFPVFPALKAADNALPAKLRPAARLRAGPLRVFLTNERAGGFLNRPRLCGQHKNAPNIGL